MRSYLESLGAWDEAKEEALQKTERAAVLAALAEGEKKPKPHRRELFTDVYAGATPAHLQEQEAEMLDHIAKYGETYTESGH